MAKAGIRLAFRAYSRRDPVTGVSKTFLRDARSRQTSPRLKAFQRCVADSMRGKTFRGGSATENARAIRSAFASAAKSCAVGGARR